MTNTIHQKQQNQRFRTQLLDKLMKNVENAAVSAQYKYDSSKHTTVWLLDQSSCHEHLPVMY